MHNRSLLNYPVIFILNDNIVRINYYQITHGIIHAKRKFLFK